jgi:hypothetical protein
MAKNKHIDTYSTVYGVDVVVANKSVELKDLQKLYTYSDDKELGDEVKDCLASTATCKNRKTGRYVILVKYNKLTSIVGVNKKLDLINTASHEAFHALMYLLTFANQDINPDSNVETQAYYMGWLTEIIYNTWTKK